MLHLILTTNIYLFVVKALMTRKNYVFFNHNNSGISTPPIVLSVFYQMLVGGTQTAHCYNGRYFFALVALKITINTSIKENDVYPLIGV